MNKFSKTSYPRHPAHSNILSSMQQNKQKKLGAEQRKPKTGDLDCEPVHTLMEKRIQIDPSLLFGNKGNGRTNKPNNNPTVDKINLQSNKEFYSTVNDGFLKKNKQRPQSKQQSRVKVAENLSLSKRNQDFAQRPQTSKGQRNVVYRREARNKSLADESDYEVEPTREAKTAFGSRRRPTPKQLEFQTSIDPEFLALFAS